MEYLRYKGKGEHSVNELEKIIEQREEELHLIKSGQNQLPKHDIVGQSEQLLCSCDNVHWEIEIKTNYCWYCLKSIKEQTDL